MRKEVYAEDIPDDVYARMKKDSYDEEFAFRKQMKDVEEFATSGAVAIAPKRIVPGDARRHSRTKVDPVTVAGMRVKVAHRMGDRFDVQVQDPFTKQAKTVVSHQYDLRGRRVGTDVAWTPGDPHSIAAVFGIPFVSAFGDLPKAKPQSVVDEETIEKARREVRFDAQVKAARESEEMRLDYEAYLRSRGKSQHQVPPSIWLRSENYKKRRGVK